MVESTHAFAMNSKVVVISGASRGIGEAMAVAFARAGARLVIASRKQEGIEAAAERIRHEVAGAEVMAQVCHAGKSEHIEALFAAALERFGRVDVVINNAATNPYFGPMVGTERAAFDKTIEVNLRGYLEIAQGAARHFVAEGKAGSIINVASVVALTAGPLQGVYAMTKAGVVSMTKTLAVELGPSNIRVNAIAPGLVNTRLAAGIVNNSDLVERVVGRTPLGRYAEPHEIAGAALYLASDAASFVTGHTLVVDGGMTIA